MVPYLMPPVEVVGDPLDAHFQTLPTKLFDLETANDDDFVAMQRWKRFVATCFANCNWKRHDSPRAWRDCHRQCSRSGR